MIIELRFDLPADAHELALAQNAEAMHKALRRIDTLARESLRHDGRNVDAILQAIRAEVALALVGVESSERG